MRCKIHLPWLRAKQVASKARQRGDTRKLFSTAYHILYYLECFYFGISIYEEVARHKQHRRQLFRRSNDVSDSPLKFPHDRRNQHMITHILPNIEVILSLKLAAKQALAPLCGEGCHACTSPLFTPTFLNADVSYINCQLSCFPLPPNRC